MTHGAFAEVPLVWYTALMHSEARGPVEGPSLATWQETAKVPSSHIAADAQLRRELNPTFSTAPDLVPASSRQRGPTAFVGFKLRRNLRDFA